MANVLAGPFPLITVQGGDWIAFIKRLNSRSDRLNLDSSFSVIWKPRKYQLYEHDCIISHGMRENSVLLLREKHPVLPKEESVKPIYSGLRRKFCETDYNFSRDPLLNPLKRSPQTVCFGKSAFINYVIE